MWQLEYDTWLSRCQVGGNITYPPRCLDYKKHLSEQAAVAGSRSKPHWLGLPAQGVLEQVEGIGEAERDLLLGIVDGLKDSEKEVVAGVVNNLNTMYALLPAEVSGPSYLFVQT